MYAAGTSELTPTVDGNLKKKLELQRQYRRDLLNAIVCSITVLTYLSRGNPTLKQITTKAKRRQSVHREGLSLGSVAKDH